MRTASQMTTFPRGVAQGWWQPMVQQYLWHPKRGLEPVNGPPGTVVLGTYHRMSDGMWRVRVKRRGAGHTWSRVSNKHPLIKRIKLEALLQGVQL